MKNTIIVLGKYEDVTIFESREKAEEYLEPIDIRNGEYTIYDASGKRLQASIEKDLKGIERVTLLIAEDPIINIPEIKRILVGLLSRSGYPKVALDKMELDQLVRESLEFKTG